MNVCAGLVGLPNVGKSTLFNALTNSSVPAENYPFCTIDPHIACTAVPDKRIEKLKTIYQSEQVIPAAIQFVDIAGLVKGAASGEGLGNKFLSHIREVDLIIHVLRCFEDSQITYAGDNLDPLGDFTIIMQELMLKDLESIEKRKEKVAQLIKKNQQNTKLFNQYTTERDLLIELEAALNSGDSNHIRKLVIEKKYKELPLLCAKNFLIVANISEQELENNQYTSNPYYQLLIDTFGNEKVIPIAAKFEEELSRLPEQEAKEIMSMLGIKSRGLHNIIKRTYSELGLITFFTCGPKEIHAWPVQEGSTIRKAAGEIHTDLEHGFIAADIFNYKDIINCSSLAKLKESGKIRTEGQDYIVKDGDIVLVRFNV